MEYRKSLKHSGVKVLKFMKAPNGDRKSYAMDLLSN